ncbi:MAG: arsenite S-adenosylmethyltransferase [Ignavibacteria bacterium GWB2_35_12]|nr:MAG: arsenite S-adenosylmethyltransferase [Ignavibacteria bacterium GWA2_35_8]OGU39061.1 MAG: arsenite S-adenosylmethyltransferase [Ignavibacteria bacterium GWB2_35_12]OGU87908.1 MAG: arsenite S-adenosylmethyltransferase [Ignavibacteria bacterium RIFOXYA2_FULL_35_10]OGV21770.1 MAG: arsenite S-adenosylmethyltransferase [Ignavibacteria bacterium RIFOXYC2_FULL_35_21]
MRTDDEIKEIVKEKYGQIAREADKQNSESGCCCGCGPYTIDYTVMSDDYKGIDGYFNEADLGLGCGLPTEFAKIQNGETVLDLGSGAGNDVFIARRYVGETGRVIGVDMTQDMLDKARENCKKLNYDNVEFRLGEIENLPVDNNTIDLIISNCVLNLVPNKEKAFSEIFRVLKSGGRFCISDIVLNAVLPEKLQSAAEMYAGCVAGAMQKNEYMDIIKSSGFSNIQIVKEKNIKIPSSVLMNYLDLNEIDEFRKNLNPIVSITVVAEKNIN